MPEEQSISDPIDTPPRGRRHWLRVALIATIAVVTLFSTALLNHNYRIIGQARSSFEESLNQSLDAAIDYLDSRRMEFVQYNPNSALTYMIRDMAELTDDERLAALVEGYANKFSGILLAADGVLRAGKPGWQTNR